MGELVPGNQLSCRRIRNSSDHHSKHQQSSCIITILCTKTKCCFSSGLSAIKKKSDYRNQRSIQNSNVFEAFDRLILFVHHKHSK